MNSLDVMSPRQDVVHLWPAVGESMNLVFARDAHDMFAPRLFGIDLGIEDLLVPAFGLGKCVPARIAYPASADERKALFRSHAVHRGIIDAVFEGPRVDYVCSDTLGPRWPIRGEHHQFGSQEGQRTRRFRE